MKLGRIAESILDKKFSDRQIEKFVGKSIGAHLAYAASDEIRVNAASGGVVSSILIDLIENKKIDGALVCKSTVIDGQVRAKFYIAQSKEQILNAQGSTYVATKFSSEALSLISEFDGKVGVVGLPCDLTNLKKKAMQDSLFQKKIIITIALTCGHNSQTKLIDNVVEKLEKNSNSSLNSYRFRSGHWRGNLVAGFENGEIIKKSFSNFSLYQNLFFFAEKKCLYCGDHFGYDADISIGDVWSYKYKNRDIKSSGVLIKTENGNDIINEVIKRKAIIAEPLDVVDIVEGQKRAAPFHYNVSAKHLAGKRFGLSIPDITQEKVKWHEYLSAFIVLFNWKWSQSDRFSHLIFKMPRFIMKIYLYLFKGLESLK